jgi:hypothetical protein
MLKPKQVKLRKIEALRRLQELPGIGPSLADDLFKLGYQVPEDLHEANPVAMFTRLEELTGSAQDPCVYDAFQCAVYFASTEDPEPLLSQWWTWSRLRKEGRTPGLPPTPFRRDRRIRNNRKKTPL